MASWRSGGIGVGALSSPVQSVRRTGDPNRLPVGREREDDESLEACLGDRRGVQDREEVVVHVKAKSGERGPHCVG